ncbi:protein MET1, chloroplastic isoform X2 [Juglans regia]|uniref:Protein MET1, chloroplastic isoform X2 n=1 Tax=Juglans regia TaxID=51240 RepID=A0A6P9E1B3_JUGRE|nr:protein MET1, chloroplastic isoform X2 [Juglans regia]
MSLALYSSPPLPRTIRTPALVFQSNHLSFNNHSFLSPSNFFSRTQLLKPSLLIVKTSETGSQMSKPGGGSEGGGGDEQQYEEYEVELVQPYGLRFAKGRDGGTYVDAIAPGGSAEKSGMFTVGDKVLATSAVFGTEIWSAAEYGRTMYTIRQRVGPLLMRMQKRYGKREDSGELTEKEIIRAERNSGVISNRVREIQLQNALRKKEQKELRTKDLREGLQLYKNAKYEEALERFESVLGSQPDLDEASVASYNVACCYSKLNQIQAGLSALEDALQAGFEDFKRIRTDPDLASIRTSEEFETLLKRTNKHTYTCKLLVPKYFLVGRV